MDDNKDIEKVSRSVFEDFKMEVPDHAWDRLDADLNKSQAVVYKQKANRFRLLSIALLFIMFSFVTCQYLIPTSTTKDIASVINVEDKITNKASLNPKVSQNNSTQDITEKNLVTTENINESAKSEHIISHSSMDTKRNEELTMKVTLIEELKHTELNKGEKQNSRTTFRKIPKVKSESIVLTYPTKTIANELDMVGADDGMISTTEQSISEEGILGNELVVLADTNKFEPVNIVKIDSAISAESISKSKLSIELFYSPSNSWCNLTDNTNDNFDDVAMYNNREDSKFSYSSGVNLKYDLNPNWSLISGVAYTNVAKSMTIQTMFAEANANNEMHFQYPTSNGVIEIPVNDSYPNLHPGDSINSRVVCNQNIKFINVPLMIRLQMTKKKFTWYANAGFSANFIIQEKAKINMDNSEMTILNHINGLKKMNFGFLLGAGVQRNLSDNFGIFIEPVFKGSFTSITRNMAVNSYPYSMGVNLGVSLHF
ncbi:hypothetical protein BH11BAC2_BH11BAC2_26410 [soil metagenome]